MVFVIIVLIMKYCCNWISNFKWRERKCSYAVAVRREKDICCLQRYVYIVTYNLILLSLQNEMLGNEWVMNLRDCLLTKRWQCSNKQKYYSLQMLNFQMKDYSMLLRTDSIFYLLRKNINSKYDLLYVQEQSNNYILENRMNLR